MTRDQTGRTDQTDQTDDELVRMVKEIEARGGQGRVVVDLTEEEKEQRYWARQIDPDDVKVVNWSRKRKRSKKIWNPKRGRGTGTGNGVNPEAAAENIRKALGGGQ